MLRPSGVEKWIIRRKSAERSAPEIAPAIIIKMDEYHFFNTRIYFFHCAAKAYDITSTLCGVFKYSAQS